MKKLRKAFTLVELVIVIAVVAILAAVLIPTISGVVDNANYSKDLQIAKNMTKHIALNTATDKITNEYDVWVILEESYGADYIKNLSAQSKGNNFWYDIKEKEVFVGNNETLEARERQRTDIKF